MIARAAEIRRSHVADAEEDGTATAGRSRHRTSLLPPLFCGRPSPVARTIALCTRPASSRTRVCRKSPQAPSRRRTLTSKVPFAECRTTPNLGMLPNPPLRSENRPSSAGELGYSYDRGEYIEVRLRPLRCLNDYRHQSPARSPSSAAARTAPPRYTIWNLPGPPEQNLRTSRHFERLPGPVHAVSSSRGERQ